MAEIEYEAKEFTELKIVISKLKEENSTLAVKKIKNLKDWFLWEIVKLLNLKNWLTDLAKS